MKPIKLTESEKRNILKLHKSNILFEQSQGKTIADIQALVGTNPDNKLGPITLAAIKTRLGQSDKSSTPTIDGFTYEQLKMAGWTDEQIVKTKYSSLIPQKSTTSEVSGDDGSTYEDMIKAGWTDDTLLKSYGFNDKSKKYKTRIDVDKETIDNPTSDEIPRETMSF